MSWELRRRKMVERYVEARGVREPRVVAAMLAVPRHLFVEEALQERVYGDDPLPIGSGQTISRPYTVARMSELLELQPEHRVLEIGTGSGYQAAVLARLARQVYTIERIPELAERAKKVFRTLKMRNVMVRVGDGSEGWPENAPYDRILLTAVCRGGIPDRLQAQLREDGGALVAPVETQKGQEIVILRTRKGCPVVKRVEACGFVPLIEGPADFGGGGGAPGRA
jgi:protein-L-isoaspartate(D-aspartate) O-methyltransferase